MDFEDYINTIEETLCALGNVQTKAINYGAQIILTDAGKKVTLNIYNGKKGIRLVWGGGDSELQKKAVALVHSSPGQTDSILSDEPDFPGIWMGSDESGKGDYFGPLVVASVCLDVQGGNSLRNVGVRDCKALTDTKILELAEVIQKTALAYSVLVMKPHAYNMRYEQVQKQGGNLNTLLALGHIAALKQTWQKYPECTRAVVDQFANNEVIPDGVHAFAPEMKVFQRPRAEEDIAVAAASVLARAAFLQTIQELGQEAGIGRIPKGGGEAATNAARRLVQKQGAGILGNYVKLHFANTQKL